MKLFFCSECVKLCLATSGTHSLALCFEGIACGNKFLNILLEEFIKQISAQKDGRTLV